MLLGRENYNIYIRNEFPKYLEEFYDKMLTPFEGKVTKVEVTEDDRLISYYVDNDLTCNFYFEVFYKLKDKNDKLRDQPSFIITVPKLLTSVWVIKGGIRVPVLFMDSDYNIRSYSSSFTIDNDRKIMFENQVFKYTVGTGFDREFKEVPYSEVDHLPIELRQLSDYQSVKLAVKLKEKTPSNGYVLTGKLCQKIQDKFQGYQDQFEDFILDKKLLSPHMSLLQHIRANMNDRDGLRSNIRKKLYRYRKLYAKDLQAKINRFFAMQSDSVLSVQNPSSNNMLNFSTVSSKLVIDKTRTFFNESFADLIDVARTPESVGNVNKNNDLNVCTVVEEDGSFSIKCYDINFKPIKIPYYKYYDGKVIQWDSVDYILEKVQVPLTYKWRGQKMQSTKLDSSFIIDAKPDEKLSITSRNVPMMNHSDSVRSGSLAGNMIDTDGCHVKIIQSKESNP